MPNKTADSASLTVAASAADRFAQRLDYERFWLERAIEADRQKPRQPRWQPVDDSGRTSTAYVTGRVERLIRRWYPSGRPGPAAELYNAAEEETRGYPAGGVVLSELKTARNAHQAIISEALNGGGPNCCTWGPAKDAHDAALAALVDSLPAVGKATETPGKKADEADSKTDNRKKSSKRLQPKDKDVAYLCRRLGKDLSKGVKQIDIALEIAQDDQAKAKSLLRQARRFRHLWQAPKSGQ